MSLKIIINGNQKISITNYKLDNCVINEHGLIFPNGEVLTQSKWSLTTWKARFYDRNVSEHPSITRLKEHRLSG